MGKYMRRKSKTTREVSLMELPSLGGVLTRAKALALRKAAVSAAVSSSGSYIQLRSRRLVKPTSPKKQRDNSVKKLGVKEKIRRETEIKDGGDLGIDDEKGSFGENVLEIEGKERGTRETTPCSLIRDPDAIRTPGSSTKPPCSTDGNYRVQNSTARRIPSTTEMDEFFTEPEKEQQKIFIEKYNFDPVNEKPLPGRYEWVKVDDS